MRPRYDRAGADGEGLAGPVPSARLCGVRERSGSQAGPGVRAVLAPSSAFGAAALRPVRCDDQPSSWRPGRKLSGVRRLASGLGGGGGVPNGGRGRDSGSRAQVREVEGVGATHGTRDGRTGPETLPAGGECARPCPGSSGPGQAPRQGVQPGTSPGALAGRADGLAARPLPGETRRGPEAGASGPSWPAGERHGSIPCPGAVEARDFTPRPCGSDRG